MLNLDGRVLTAVAHGIEHRIRYRVPMAHPTHNIHGYSGLIVFAAAEYAVLLVVRVLTS